MRRSWHKWLLAKLIEKYERSKAFRESGDSQRKINLPFSPEKIPDYHYGDYREKAEIANAAEELNKMEVVSIRWVKGEKGNLIEELVLNLNRLEAAYCLAGIRPRKDEIDEFLRQLDGVQWAVEILGLSEVADEWRNQAFERKRVTSVLPKNEKVRNDCLLALGCMAELNDDTDERMFSLMCYGNSKAFSGNVKASLARVLRLSSAYLPDEEENDAETLEKFGILEGGSDFRIAGPLSVRLGGGILDISPAKGGVALAPDDVKGAEVAWTGATAMVSVENLAVFREVLRRGLPEKTILVYSGGFYSQRKLGLLRRIRDAMFASNRKSRFFHWGDIDLGGLRIFLHLRKNAIPELQSMHMSPETLKKHMDYCCGFDDAYAAKLVRLKEDGQVELSNLVETMIKRNARLEQEAILCAGKEPLKLP